MKKVAAGAGHSLAIRSDGTLWAWGWACPLGDGTAPSRSMPVQVGGANDWVAVTAGYLHTVGLKSDGTLWAWGINKDGRLGDGTSVDKFTPVQVGGDHDWAAVNAGQHHTVGLKSDGTLWAWGWNVVGQLGDGTTINRTAPVQVGGANNWVAVTGGALHTVGLKSDGTLWAWGSNLSGRLGDGTSVDKFTPVQVGSASDWVAVTAGHGHTVGLKSDGTLWAWGWNVVGQLGDGTTVNRSTPVQVGGDHDWVAVAAGANHSIGLKADGGLWVWGWNNDGQLGDGTSVNRSTPVQVGSDHDWVAAAGGNGHSVALKADGKLWAWGYNLYGQLGGGTMLSVSANLSIRTPVQVALPEVPAAFTISGIASPGASAWAANSRGEIVGGYAPVALESRAYVWTAAAADLSDLGTLGGNYARAYDINARGEIAGVTKYSLGATVGFRLRPVDQNGDGVQDVWYQDDNEDDVNDLMEPLEHQEHQIEIAAINTAGIIAGNHFTLDNSNYRRGVLWLPDNASVDLGGPAGSQTLPSDLNDSGTVVGTILPSSHPFVILPQIRNNQPLWYEDVSPGDGNNDLILELDQFNGYRGMAVNNAGTVCLRSSGLNNSVLWRNGAVVASLSPGGDLYARANSINDHEQVVGRLETGKGDQAGAFVWTARGGFIRLPGLVGSTTTALGIDPSGTIVVGMATDAAGVDHGVKWSIPVNTPRGSSISVWLETDIAGSLAGITFENVTSPGTTVVISSGTGPELPTGFKMGNPPMFCELSTSATFEGWAQVCFRYEQSAFLNETALRLFHYEAGEWKDVTIALDTVNNVIWGRVSSFSPFVILENALTVTIEEPASGFLASVNTPITFRGSFADSDGIGPYAGKWAFSSTMVPEYSVPATVGAGVVQDQISFPTPGVYTVDLTITGNGQPAKATTVANDLPAYVVIYDPTGGFVTGGGWIDSPLGAYTRDPLLTGKATFGFVSKYLKGATVPTGNTEFQFKAGDLNFKSTAYQWLVVAGARGQFKGWGTINGQGNYGFILTAIDGQINGGGGADRFRIKIWDMPTDVLVYDNQVGTGDDAELDDDTVIQGGSIVIHKP